MAREESDREDLLREATGLVDRVELALAGFTEPLVFGFRRNGAVSIFVSQDEVYQFDATGAWRRSYLSGRLLKAEAGRMVELTRERSADQTVLWRRELTDEELITVRVRLETRLVELQVQLREGSDVHVTGQVSASGQDVLQRFVTWLDAMRNQSLRIAQRPGLK